MNESKKTKLMNILQGSGLTVFNRQSILTVLNSLNTWRFRNPARLNAFDAFGLNLLTPSTQEPRYLARIEKGVYELRGVDAWSKSMSKWFLQEQMTAVRLSYIAWTHLVDDHNTYYGAPAIKVEVTLGTRLNANVLPFKITSVYEVRPGGTHPNDDFTSPDSHSIVTITEDYPVIITGKGATEVDYPNYPIFGARLGRSIQLPL